MLLDGGDGEQIYDNNFCKGIHVDSLRHIPNRPGALQYLWALNTDKLHRSKLNASDIFVTLYYKRDDDSR